MAQATSLAEELNDSHALAAALLWATILDHLERNPAEVARLASYLIELSTRQNFAFWLPAGEIFRSGARSASGSTGEGIAWIEDGIRDYRVTGSMLRMPYFLALKAEALHFADCVPEALQVITEAEVWVERSEERWWCAELHRLRGVFLTALGVDESQIGPSFCAAIETAKEQKSISLEKRAQATYAEYRTKRECGRRTWIPTTSLLTHPTLCLRSATRPHHSRARFEQCLYRPQVMIRGFRGYFPDPGHMIALVIACRRARESADR
jgi:predicted ATPase